MKTTILILILLLCQNPSIVLGQTLEPVDDQPQRIPLYNLKPIHELNERKTRFGTYHVIGYVVKKYSCPPCLAGRPCKACLQEHIIISEENQELPGGKLSGINLIIFVENAKIFETGRKYRFLIHFLDLKTTDQPVNDAKLIYFENVEEAVAP